MVPVRVLFVTGTASALLAACASNGGAGPRTAAVAPGGSGPSVAVVARGGHLATADGRTLYLLSDDSVSHLACTGMCLSEWPPLVGTGRAGPGVDPGALTVVQRGGGNQVVYHGHPLYEFSGDMSAGDQTGVGLHEFGGTWRLVTAAGAAAVTPTAAG